MKLQLLVELLNELHDMHLHNMSDGSTDIALFQRFMEDCPSRQPIIYEAAILLNESERNIIMYERIQEEKSEEKDPSGFAFDKLVYRSVRSLEKDPQGNTFEAILNLRDVSKRVRSIAQSYGWSFTRTQLRKKASFPNGHHKNIIREVGVNPSTPWEEKEITYCHGCGTALAENDFFCSTCGQRVI